jgi:hypothetical protein
MESRPVILPDAVYRFSFLHIMVIPAEGSDFWTIFTLSQDAIWETPGMVV